MDLSKIIAFLQPFLPLLKAELMQIESNGQAELKAVIANIQSPDLKALLVGLDGALDAFAQLEIGKLA